MKIWKREENRAAIMKGIMKMRQISRNDKVIFSLYNPIRIIFKCNKATLNLLLSRNKSSTLYMVSD